MNVRVDDGGDNRNSANKFSQSAEGGKFKAFTRCLKVLLVYHVLFDSMGDNNGNCLAKR
ncbi:MAG: hypothetical protein ACI8Z1_000484 [Candidatus Azotimanducaceae bacterium]